MIMINRSIFMVHDVATAVILDLQAIKHKDSGEDVSYIYWWDINVIKREEERRSMCHVSPNIQDL